MIQTQNSETHTYPRHNIDPAKKNIEWGKQYAKAAWHDWTFSYPKTMFQNNNGTYQKNRLYALGKQPIDQYKKWLGVDQQTNQTWLNIDWSVRPIISTYRDRAISRLMKQEHGIVATPIDPTAKSELEQLYAQMKARIVVRQQLQQMNPELANHPMIQAQPGEPMDMEELEMRIDFGEQFNRSKDAEQAIQLGLYENNDKQFRKEIFEDLFDLGVAGYKEWLGEDNKPKFRRVDPDAVVTNYIQKKDFSDMIHCGEVISVPLVDLAALTDEDGNRVFTDDQLAQLAQNFAGQYSNPRFLSPNGALYKGYDRFKVQVLDLEFYSWNDYNWKMFVNEKGELVDVRRAEYGRGKTVPEKYMRRRVKVVYKIKWIIGTDYAYDFGLKENMKRTTNPRKRAETTLSYKFVAYNFYEMRAQSIMDRLIPILDEYQMTIYKIQNFRNRMVPSGWWIDLDALENVALSKGGKNMEPMELLDMFFQTGVMVGRSKDIMGDNVNYKPIIPIQNAIAQELEGLYRDLVMCVQQIEAVTGFNPITTGNPNPKTLTAGYEIADISTEDALFPLSFAETMLMEKLANDIMIRIQQGVKRGGVEGYAPALNSNTLKFIRVSPDVSLREYGIMLEEKTTEDQKQLLLQQIMKDQAQGILDTSDAIYILNTYNVKQAQMILAYRVKKAREAMQQLELQKIQMNNEGAAQAAAAAEQAKQQTLQLEYTLKMQLEELKIRGQLAMKQLELSGKAEMNTVTAEAKVAAQAIANEGNLQKELLKSQTNGNKETTA